MDIRLIWDGEQVFWSYGEDETWRPLTGTDSGAVQFPHYAAEFDATAPETLRGYSPPFLTEASALRPGAVQMWTGLLAKTRSRLEPGGPATGQSSEFAFPALGELGRDH